ncbi:c-type cytochrome, partial [Ralstonia pseudosolanacearum]|uniref:c-type cytochrome n=1 Tax=Ralstonia pseudosolanacearum TaxID=1310165 RepID=UPI003CE72E0F
DGQPAAERHRDHHHGQPTRCVDQGGLGVWGQIPMPANPKISDADLKTVIDWVLAGAPAK